MIDWTKPVQTRDGREVQIVRMEGVQPFPVIGYVKNKYKWDLYTWRIDGTRVAVTDSSDLINVPEPKVLMAVGVGDDGTWSRFTAMEIAALRTDTFLNLSHIVTIYRQPNGDVTTEIERLK